MLVWETQVLLLLLLTSLFLFLPTSRLSSAKQHVLKPLWFQQQFRHQTSAVKLFWVCTCCRSSQRLFHTWFLPARAPQLPEHIPKLEHLAFIWKKSQASRNCRLWALLLGLLSLCSQSYLFLLFSLGPGPARTKSLTSRAHFSLTTSFIPLERSWQYWKAPGLNSVLFLNVSLKPSLLEI